MSYEHGQAAFAQIMEFIPWTSFARIVERYGGDIRVRNLSCPEQFRAMAQNMRGISRWIWQGNPPIFSAGQK